MARVSNIPLQEYPDTISINWHYSDVLEGCPELSDNQAKRALWLAKCEHDANEGINWDTLEYWGEYVLKNPE